MKRFLLSLFLSAILITPIIPDFTPDSQAAISVVSTRTDVFGAGGGTTTGITTTGADTIIVSIWYYTSLGVSLSDSKGNTWNALSAYSNLNMAVKTYYCTSCTVGTSHTFTTSASFAGVGVLAVSGGATSPFDQESGNAANASGNIQPGSLTPSVNNTIVVSSFGSFNGTAPSMPTGYTQVASNTTATAEAGGMGYKIQTTASAENPTWNGSGSSQAVNLTIFKPAGAAAATGKLFFLLVK